VLHDLILIWTSERRYDITTVPVGTSRFSYFSTRGEKREPCKACLISRHKDLGVRIVDQPTCCSYTNKPAVAVLRNNVQALVAPITTQANRSLEESRRREFAHFGLDREDGVIEDTTTKPIPTLKFSLASLPPFWIDLAANILTLETLHWVPSSLGSNRGVFLFCFLIRVLAGVSDGQLFNGSHWKVACSIRHDFR
jgi:hypothetical protein